jgi:hypothetical protein
MIVRAGMSGHLADGGAQRAVPVFTKAGAASLAHALHCYFALHARARTILCLAPGVW